MKKNKNIEIREYIRMNPHLNDDILAEKFDVSKRSISANRAHITMGTDTDSPQARRKAVKHAKMRMLTIVSGVNWELRINNKGDFYRLDLVKRLMVKITDDEAKGIMLTKLAEK